MNAFIPANTPLSANKLPFACFTAFWKIRLFTVWLYSEHKGRALETSASARRIIIYSCLWLSRWKARTSSFKLHLVQAAKVTVWHVYIVCLKIQSCVVSECGVWGALNQTLKWILCNSRFSHFLDASYVQYFGDSFLQFKGIDLSALNNITVRFQTHSAQGTILYMDQGPANTDYFFMKLFIQDGILQVKAQLPKLPRMIMH